MSLAKTVWFPEDSTEEQAPELPYLKNGFTPEEAAEFYCEDAMHQGDLPVGEVHVRDTEGALHRFTCEIEMVPTIYVYPVDK